MALHVLLHDACWRLDARAASWSPAPPLMLVRTGPSRPYRPAGVTAGYGDEVIFADGTFIDGSTAELSADGPIREPYVVYCQVGGAAVGP